MRLLVDAQLPVRLVPLLIELGHDVAHTSELPNGNRTPDREITRIAEVQDRIVVTKDRDFVDGLCHALDQWKHWANGRNLDNTALAEIAATLQDHDDRPGISQLAAPLMQWAQRRGLELQPPTQPTPTRSSIGIEIDF